MNVAEQMKHLALEAKQAATTMAELSSAVKNELLCRMADALEAQTAQLQQENEKDLQAAPRDNGLSSAMIDRLVLNDDRVKSMADGLREVAALPDPVGEVTGMWRRPLTAFRWDACVFRSASSASFSNHAPMLPLMRPVCA